MAKRRILPPRLGAANNTAYYDVPGGAVPPERLQNFRIYTSEGDRPTGGIRPGIRKWSQRQVGGGGVGQGMGTLRRARTPLGYAKGSASVVATGWQFDTNGLGGCLYGLRPNLGMFFGHTGNPNSEAGAAAACVAIDPNAPYRVAVARTYTVGGYTRVSVVVYDISQGEGILDTNPASWEWTIQETNVNRFVNCMCFAGGWLLVGSNNHVVGLYNDGTHNLQVNFDCNGWSGEIIDIKPFATPDAGAPNGGVYVLFNGSQSIGGGGSYFTGYGGCIISSGIQAGEFRSGVMKCYCIPPVTGGVAATVPLGQLPWAPDLGPTDFFREDGYSPAYLRLAQLLPRKPRGAAVTGLAVYSDNSIAVSHTNSGWGPASSPNLGGTNASATSYFPPDCTAMTPTTVSRFDANGNFLWTSDSFSIIATGNGGFLNDIPVNPGDIPSLTCITMDASGNVYVAGKANAQGNTLFAFGGDGSLMWATALGGTVARQGISVGSDGNLIVVGNRNNAWGSGVPEALLWQVRPVDGYILNSYDLGQSVNASGGVAISTKGDIFFGTGFV